VAIQLLNLRYGDATLLGLLQRVRVKPDSHSTAVAPVEAPGLNRFRHVPGRDRLRARQVGDRAGHLEDAVVGARRQATRDANDRIVGIEKRWWVAILTAKRRRVARTAIRRPGA
jgi:hypothetical protein